PHQFFPTNGPFSGAKRHRDQPLLPQRLPQLLGPGMRKGIVEIFVCNQGKFTNRQKDGYETGVDVNVLPVNDFAFLGHAGTGFANESPGKVLESPGLVFADVYRPVFAFAWVEGFAYKMDKVSYSPPPTCLVVRPVPGKKSLILDELQSLLQVRHSLQVTG